MKTMTLLCAGSAAILAFLLQATCTEAAPRTWVSSTGGGTTCSRAQPCADFQTAHNATDPEGEINCVDAGDFGTLFITKAITVDCTRTPATISASVHQTAITIQILTGTATVTLRGLLLNGHGSFFGCYGVDFTAGKVLRIENSRISGFKNQNQCSGFDGGTGIHLSAGNAQAMSVFVSDSVINDNGQGDGGGIVIKPFQNSSVRAIIERTRIENNTVGIFVDASTNTARSVIKIDDSMIAGNTANGIMVTEAGMLINRTSVEGNDGNGILAGPGSVIHLGASTVATNALGGLAYNGGQIFSYQNNQIKGNRVDNAPSGVLALQ